MHIFLIFLFCITSLIHSADDEHDERYYIQHSWPELPEHVVMSADAQQLKNAPQDIKNQALYNALATYNSYTYPSLRSKIAQAIYAGAHVAEVQKKQTGLALRLPNIALRQDLPLVRLFVEHGADVDQKGTDQEPAIFNAYRAAVAQLLIDRGALNYLTEPQKYQIFMKAMWDDREPALITLYKAHNFNVMACDAFNNTLLMSLLFHPHKEIVEKARLLLQDLPQDHIKQLISTQNHHGKTVLSRIEEKTHYYLELDPYFRDIISYLNELHTFLLKKLNDSPEQDDALVAQLEKLDITPKVDPRLEDECAICLEQLHNRSLCTETSCKHLFHQKCLRSSIKECPLCRGQL